MKNTRPVQRTRLQRFLIGGLVIAYAGCASLRPPLPEEVRVHDSRIFTTGPAASSFAAMPDSPGDAVAMASTSRFAGVLGGASYMVEVPADWNGKLVMFAHGYRGTGAALTVNPPLFRRHLIQSGYAWAASSYSKNFYDVRAGVEDTNALANAFNTITKSNGRTLLHPTRTYITGFSMGGHIAVAAIEAETAATAKHKTTYHGAVPMCGVTADTEHFQILARHRVAALAAAQLTDSSANVPPRPWSDVQAEMTQSLFTSFPTNTSPNTPITLTARGEGFATALQALTGGERPLFREGLAFGGSFRSAYGIYGNDGTVDGVLNQDVLTQPDANRLRRDGLRWIPVVNGAFKVPVVTLHTLGDLYVPFAMTQEYQKRAKRQGNAGWLVQRAIRGAAHCDFTVAEQAQAFDDVVRWEQGGTRPAGDDVLNTALVATPSFGCRFTNNTLGQDDGSVIRGLRAKIAAATPACPPN